MSAAPPATHSQSVVARDVVQAHLRIAAALARMPLVLLYRIVGNRAQLEATWGTRGDVIVSPECPAWRVSRARIARVPMVGRGPATPESGLFHKTPVSALISAPLVYSGRQLGALIIVDSRPRPDLEELDEGALAATCELIAQELRARSGTEPPPKQTSSGPVTTSVPEWVARSVGLHPVTGLPDRSALLGALEAAVSEASTSQTATVVTVVALDRFQRIDDGLGRAIGDEVLRQVAARLLHVASEHDLVAHLGGDEFAVMFTRLGAPMAAHASTDRLLHALREPFHVHGYELSLSASIGMAGHPSDASDAAQLLRFASIAMHRAKERGRGRLHTFTPEMREAVERRGDTERGLRRALGNGELMLHYQPKLDLQSRRVTGVEALLRWKRSGDIMSPGLFIPIAEETGLIVPIGTWCLLEACQQMRLWLDQGLALETIAVNVSALQFSRLDFVGTVERALRAAALAPHHLELEVTESLVMDDLDGTAERLTALRLLGVRIAIDDFGTGYSSLSYLQRLPVDLLKIDRSFVANLDQQGNRGTNARALAEVITGLGHNLGLRVLAEGVETQAQLDALVALNCDEAQGYYFARPVPPADLPHLMRAPRPK